MKNQIKVEWIADKCPHPQDCGKCLETCPQAVFALYASDRKEGVIPDQYVIAPALQFFCTGCGACTDACPNDAITLTPNA
jgi:NAD-dependent dihydropyrimidine dehydrogenase PreA subunit